MDRMQVCETGSQLGLALTAGEVAQPRQPQGAAPASFRVLSVGKWQLARVHSALRELAREGFELWATVEHGAGGMELWLVQH